MVDLRINDSMDGLDVAQTLSVNPLDSILDGVNSVVSIQNAVQPALDAMENTLANIPELGNTNLFDWRCKYELT